MTGTRKTPAGERKPENASLPPRGARLRYTADRIRRRVEAMAKRISRDFPGGVVLVGVLNGGVFLLSDLARLLSVPVRLDFLRVRSYGDGRSAETVATITRDVEGDLSDRDVVVVEDVVDTGRSVAALAAHLSTKKVRTVRFCALIDKRERREVDITLDYSGFLLKKGFIVGYGMDCAGEYRHLPHIYVLPPEGQRKKPSVGG
jgi:hypoxanthine phosphoribosyltransferase